MGLSLVLCSYLIVGSLHICPRCSAEEETFEYAFLSCSPRSWAKTRFLLTVFSLRQESPVWTSPALLVAMAKFIKATATGFSDNMPPLETCFPTLERVDDTSAKTAHVVPGRPPTNLSGLVAVFAAALGASAQYLCLCFVTFAALHVFVLGFLVYLLRWMGYYFWLLFYMCQIRVHRRTWLLFFLLCLHLILGVLFMP